MSLAAKREYLAKIHGRYGRAGRLLQMRIPDEFCQNCGYRLRGTRHSECGAVLDGSIE